jgi:hypothetical protein
MDAVEFGSKLILTGDLDPIYTMLNAANLPDATLKRWCLAYWMFYHAGVSSLIANEPSNMFWSMVWRAQEEKWPRGTERRHFKAENSRKAIEHLERKYPNPEYGVSWVSCEGHPIEDRFNNILARAQTWVGFGPWIAFKIADMVDAVLHVPVSFEGAEAELFDDPMAGAWLVANQIAPGMYATRELPEMVSVAKANVKSMPRTDRIEIVQQAVNLLKAAGLGKLRSPSNPAKPLALQEYETIFCKYKSHLNGHYPVGKDTHEILHGLLDPRWGPLAEKLAYALEEVTS